ALEVNKPLPEKSTQYGNKDRSQKENGNSANRVYRVNVVLIKPLDDFGHAGPGLHADSSLTQHQITPVSPRPLNPPAQGGRFWQALALPPCHRSRTCQTAPP